MAHWWTHCRGTHYIMGDSKSIYRSSCALKKEDRNTVNKTVCLTTILFGICVAVGGWKTSLVSSILIQEPQD